ncbi:3-hydroxyacyl-CoA dehydrogenase [Mycobacterium sp. MS1601]|uniref:3-hydroxyacyl-CoA dehydrogenase n=1 Tax=Mycobacterium sp. MS1601 TaxID=1936029 RepID=UPI0009796697|nr:3-hydroxyacyl-CoA dehydrogenase [Mycobacterium sp. MS1601]AQA05498.1 3-hydroxyacyl-CoA dehydrogenase [Mycobacterium sp. MS1601]
MTGRLYFLDLSGGRIVAVNPDGSDPRTLLAGLTGHPDGIIADTEGGHLYWTNMGDPDGNDGSIERIDLDGLNRTTIVAAGATFTPKQIQFEDGTLYWSDREGMRVMRAAANGSAVETLVQTGFGDTDRKDQRNWCVGIAVDRVGGKIYWTQKGADDSGHGRILRAGIDVPAGQTPAERTDIEVVYDGLPEPIDLDIDHGTRTLYWTDRGDPPRGNTVNRAPLDPGPDGRPEPEIVVDHLMEGIGLALDVAGDRMFVTDFAGTVYRAALDGSDKTTLLQAQGNLTGIAYARTHN